MGRLFEARFETYSELGGDFRESHVGSPHLHATR
jgi:hypothetical protein